MSQRNKRQIEANRRSRARADDAAEDHGLAAYLRDQKATIDSFLDNSSISFLKEFSQELMKVVELKGEVPENQSHWNALIQSFMEKESGSFATEEVLTGYQATRLIKFAIEILNSAIHQSSKKRLPAQDPTSLVETMLGVLTWAVNASTGKLRVFFVSLGWHIAEIVLQENFDRSKFGNKRGVPTKILAKTLQFLATSLSGSSSEKIKLLKNLEQKDEWVGALVDTELQGFEVAEFSISLLLRTGSAEGVEVSQTTQKIWMGIIERELKDKLIEFFKAREYVLHEMFRPEPEDLEQAFSLIKMLRDHEVELPNLELAIGFLTLSPRKKTAIHALRFLMGLFQLNSQTGNYPGQKMFEFATLLSKCVRSSDRRISERQALEIAEKLSQLWQLEDWGIEMFNHYLALFAPNRLVSQGGHLLLLVFLVGYSQKILAIGVEVTSNFRDICALLSDNEPHFCNFLELFVHQNNLNDRSPQLDSILLVIEEHLSSTRSIRVIRALFKILKSLLNLPQIKNVLKKQYDTLKVAFADISADSSPNDDTKLLLHRLQHLTSIYKTETNILTDFPFVEKLFKHYRIDRFEYDPVNIIKPCLSFLFNAYLSVFLSFFRAKTDIEGFRTRNNESRDKTISILESYMEYRNDKFLLSSEQTDEIQFHAFSILCQLYHSVSSDVTRTAMFVFFQPQSKNQYCLLRFLRTHILGKGKGNSAEKDVPDSPLKNEDKDDFPDIERRGRIIAEKVLLLLENCTFSLGKHIAADVLILLHSKKSIEKSCTGALNQYITALLTKDLKDESQSTWIIIKKLFGNPEAKQDILESICQSITKNLSKLILKNSDNEVKVGILLDGFLKMFYTTFVEATSNPGSMFKIRALRIFIKKEILKSKDELLRRLLVKARTIHTQLSLQDDFHPQIGYVSELISSLEKALDLSAKSEENATSNAEQSNRKDQSARSKATRVAGSKQKSDRAAKLRDPDRSSLKKKTRK